MTAPRFHTQPPRAGALDYVAFVAIVAGALAAVLVVLPYRAFDLDRFFAPKELALHAAALIAGLAVFSRASRITLTRGDIALLAWLGATALSALFAGNHWLAFRAATLSMSGAIVYWSARRLAAAGLGDALARALAVAVLAGALTALAQAYGVKLEFAALNRAPGGTFGNRNFMAHLAAIGVPLFIYCVATAGSALTAAWWTASLAACSAALVLSRTRAAWLALVLCAGLAAIVALRGPPLFDAPQARRRLRIALGAAAAGVILALALPNTLDWKSDNPYLDSVVGVVNFREGSGAGRLRQYANSARIALAHPVLGVGPGNWPVVYPAFAPPDDPSISETTGMASNPWPSSDWMAAFSERGVPAGLALVATVVFLVGGGLAVRYDSARTAASRLAALAGAAALAVAAIEGAFDAVLLLAVPAIVMWALAGALLAPRHEVRTIAFGARGRLSTMVALLALGVSASLASFGKMEGMRLATIGTSSALEAAVTRDPGSYRLRIRAAELYAGRGQCTRAREHAVVARALFPNSPAPKRVLQQCR